MVCGRADRVQAGGALGGLLRVMNSQTARVIMDQTGPAIMVKTVRVIMVKPVCAIMVKLLLLKADSSSVM